MGKDISRESISIHYTKTHKNGQKSARGAQRKDVTHSLPKDSRFYWNPFIVVGYRNDRSPPTHTNLKIYGMFRYNADADILSLGCLW